MVTIYHNPRCSKSRQTLALIEEKGIAVTQHLYLQDPLNENQIRDLIKKLGIDARSLLRKTEQDYKDLELKTKTQTDDELISYMAQYPKLIERPIVVNGDQARLGRPPEQVLEIL